ncbi:MAG: isoprenylcysteine carboxylmethyltransferase family protein [Desulfobacterales bacterium]|nr:MAG: isoprenylcysteine carboxylmethyltransferase family protein [Desulfobacterales bacterium]
MAVMTFMAGYIALYIRIIVLILAIIAALYLIRSGHAVAKHGKSHSGVVATGGFRYVRHPLDLGSIIFYLGLAVSTASLFSLGLVVVIFFFYDYIASYEEKLLEDRFNEAYKNYKTRTGKWVPMIGRKS